LQPAHGFLPCWTTPRNSPSPHPNGAVTMCDLKPPGPGGPRGFCVSWGYGLKELLVKVRFGTRKSGMQYKILSFLVIELYLCSSFIIVLGILLFLG
jgi:hypothetical protein